MHVQNCCLALQFILVFILALNFRNVSVDVVNLFSLSSETCLT